MHDHVSSHRHVAGFITVSALSCLLLLLASCSSGAGGAVDASDTWQVSGPLLAWDGDVWVVDGVPVVVTGPLNRDEERRLGVHVEARGSFDDAGLRIAEEVEVGADGRAESTLERVELDGQITAIDDNVWVVDGTEVLLPEATWIAAVDDEDVARLSSVGSYARVFGYRLTDERVIAMEVMLRADEAVDRVEDEPDTAPAEPTWNPAVPNVIVPSSAPDDTSESDGDGDGGNDGNNGSGNDEGNSENDNGGGESSGSDKDGEKNDDKPDKPEDAKDNKDDKDDKKDD